MDMSVYQQRARDFAIYPYKGHGLEYATLGLCGESGEFADKIKKKLRDGVEDHSAFVAAASKELGDVLWYVANIACDLGLDLAEIAHQNLEKLAGRKERGTLQGSGDNR